jgi:hypothetical protein
MDLPHPPDIDIDDDDDGNTDSSAQQIHLCLSIEEKPRAGLPTSSPKLSPWEYYQRYRYVCCCSSPPNAAVVASVSTLRRSHVRPGPSSHQPETSEEELDDNDGDSNPDVMMAKSDDDDTDTDDDGDTNDRAKCLAHSEKRLRALRYRKIHGPVMFLELQRKRKLALGPRQRNEWQA